VLRSILTASDPNKKDTTSYTVYETDASRNLLLVAGQPVIDTRFIIDASGNLKLASNVSLDYEVTPSADIIVRATDSGGLYKDQKFTISATNINEAPTDIALSNASVGENATAAVVGNLSGSDPENNTLSFSVVGTEASRFEAVQQSGVWVLALKAGVSLDYEAAHTVDVTVRASDGTLTYDEVIAITVTNVNEAPTEITL
jgi:large repetitive protein